MFICFVVLINIVQRRVLWERKRMSVSDLALSPNG